MGHDHDLDLDLDLDRDLFRSSVLRTACLHGQQTCMSAAAAAAAAMATDVIAATTTIPTSHFYWQCGTF
ncbi:hypothetical protein DHEL01_v203481 [Diaporthe helianthi]|uniref:Uncharacterized protein n=1 Tax=Diaporthe helianthi TaxID=158607 RepID=A0A2P5I6N8_DIAHE|nr:hypothetical protein DHEL01_v203481 [Diaporthe helianthi]